MDFGMECLGGFFFFDNFSDDFDWDSFPDIDEVKDILLMITVKDLEDEPNKKRK
jgi:hypothetical protein